MKNVMYLKIEASTKLELTDAIKEQIQKLEEKGYKNIQVKEKDTFIACTDIINKNGEKRYNYFGYIEYTEN